MPELPEVETLARGLRRHVQGKKIRSLTILEKRKFRGTPGQLKKFVYGQKITDIERRGKWLVLHLASGYGFVIHLKMTGQLLYQPKRRHTQVEFLGGHTMSRDELTETNRVLPNRHTRVVFTLEDGSQLFFQDMRKFGYVELYAPTELTTYFTKKKLGVEPLEHTFTLNYWQTQLRRHPATAIKAVLLNQSIIAGIGNIYADDTCWEARVQPMRRVRSLTAAEQTALFKASRKIMTEAIRLGGTSFSHYFRLDGTIGQYWHKRKVYGRTGEPCRRCNTLIQKTRCAGRGTHYCPNCQG